MLELPIYDGLDSEDSSFALSANMGRVLNEAITSMELRVTSLESLLTGFKTIIW